MKTIQDKLRELANDSSRDDMVKLKYDQIEMQSQQLSLWNKFDDYAERKQILQVFDNFKNYVEKDSFTAL